MKTERVIAHIVDWLRTYCEDAGMDGFVAGVSGGIDSAVTSTLCARTGKTVLVLSMPIHQEEKQASLAQRHVAWLERQYPSVRGLTLNLTSPFAALRAELPEAVGNDDLAMANTRARLRMATLYAVASHNRLLVAGTGNKVEDFGVGFFTKYGDGGVDLQPIGDLMKSEVYEIGKFLRVIDDILNAKPTDGLWDDNRSDEDQIGATYGDLEWAMRFEEEAADESALSDRQKRALSVYRRLHRVNRHKMEPVPVAGIPEDLK